MADSKDPKANEARPGAVKPPVLDLKAQARRKVDRKTQAQIGG